MKLTPLPIGIVLAAAGLCGCSTTGTTQAPPLAETATLAGADAGYALPLPETVSVLPQSSGIAPAKDGTVQVAAAANLPAPEAAFAGSTPRAVPATLTANAPNTAATGASYQIASLAPVAAPEQQRPAVTAADIRAAAVAAPLASPPVITVAAPMFPAAPSLPAKADASAALIASAEPVAYAGAVPFYLAPTRPLAAIAPSGRGDIEQLIAKYATLYEVPVDLVRHVVNRESTFNPKAYNHGHWGLMQIKHATARGMGYDGPAQGLFDAETNLKYAVKYLRGAWMVAGGNAKRADWLYQTGYYYDAKRQGLLDETGLGHDRVRRHRMVEPDA